MFGFGRKKCSQCGEALESMGQSGDRTDDLMKNSAIGGKQMASGLCARCRAIAGSGARQSATVAPPQPSTSVPRTVAYIADDEAVEADTSYKPGGGFKTETELQEAAGKGIEFADVKDLGSFLIWVITTKTGRNLAAIAFFILIMLMPTCSRKDDYEPADAPVVTEAPPATFEPPLPATPMPGQPLPARPANNPGSWVTTNDYPSRALSQERQGSTGFRLTVNAEGMVTGCEITQSSGHSDLDEATCKSVRRRARFDSVAGGSDDRSYRNRVTWRIPE